MLNPFLTCSGGLNAILGGNFYSKALEHGRNGFSNSKKNEIIYHMFVCPKNHLEAEFGRLAASDLKNVAFWFLNV